MTWRVVKQIWIAGFSLHRTEEDAFAFIYQHRESPNKPKDIRRVSNVDKETYDKIYTSQYGIWGN